MLPYFVSDNQPLSLLQTNWKSQLDPLIANPISNGIILNSIAITNGPNTINHKLGRLPQGWILIDSNCPATIYRDNPYTALTITLTSDVACTASFYVF